MSNRIKTILIPLSGSDADAIKPVLTIALAAARRFDAHMGALYTLPDPQEVLRHANVGLPTSTRKALIESAESSAAESATHLHRVFDAFCVEAGVPTDESAPLTGLSASWVEASGSVSDMVTHRGRLADLIVLARPVQDYPPAIVVEAALMETGRAVLLVPPQAAGTVGETVIIGWNGSKESTAAIAGAMPFLASARNVYILARSEWNKPGPPPSDVVAYLARHGIAAEVREFETGDRSVGETLLDEGREVGADLIVLGGYGHSRTREMVFGGVTQHVLVHADIPVLLAH